MISVKIIFKAWLIIAAVIFNAVFLQACSGQENNNMKNSENGGNFSMESTGGSTETLKTSETSDENVKNVTRDITTMQLVYDMGLGINLGNTLDSTGDWINSGSISNYETAWGSPIITEAMIKAYADAGFRTIRIPVTWSNMMLPGYCQPRIA